MAEQRPDRVLGAPHDSFWQWCERGELRLQKCAGCGEINWPAVASCEQCGSPSLEWQRMSGFGRIASWCTFDKDYYAGVLPMPWTNILVELAEGTWFLSEPRGIPLDRITADMPVRVAFHRCRDGHGEFNLPVFEPA